MYICVCNEITEQDLIDDPELWDQCGTQCGTCKEFKAQYRAYKHIREQYKKTLSELAK